MRSTRARGLDWLWTVGTIACLALIAAGCESSSSVTTRPDPTKCRLTLSTPAVIVAQGGAGTVLVTAQPECAWTVATEANWISDLSPTSGQGNGSFTFQATANPVPSRRETEIAVNDNRVRVSQDAQACVFTIAPGSQSVPASGANGTISVTVASGCAWTATSSDPWITIASNPSGTGTETVSYNVAANGDADGRAGSISIGSRTFVITQDGSSGPMPPPGSPNCSYTLNASGQSVSAAGGVGAPVTVTAPTGCAWTARSHASWISVTTGAAGNGNGTVAFTVAINAGAGRSGTMTIAGQTFTVTQSGVVPPLCTYAINPTSANAPAAGATGTINVTAGVGCVWTVTNNAPQWITITSGGSGSGNGAVAYAIAANTGSARSSALMVADKTFTVAQAAAPPAPTCTYSLSPTTVTVGVAGGTRTVSVTASAGCAWTATSNESWIDVASGASGTGNGTIVISIPINVFVTPRSGTITFSGQDATDQSIVVNQGIL